MSQSESGGLAIGTIAAVVIVLWAMATCPMGPMVMFGGAVVLGCIGLIFAGVYGFGCVAVPQEDREDDPIEGRVVVIEHEDPENPCW